MTKKVWRWDQGRLDYLQFNNLRLIAQTLTSLEGVEINSRGIDPLREALQNATHLHYSPANYRVWRNYKRVFECSLLATNLGGRLFVSDICKKLALLDENTIDVDDYLQLVVHRFRYPFPAFEAFEENFEITYPFCAILKFLYSRYFFNNASGITITEIFSFVIGNGCNGLESLDHYAALVPSGFGGLADEVRQVREMVIFLSQFSFLKWEKGTLLMDISGRNPEYVADFNIVANPFLTLPKENREQDFVAITSINGEELPRISVPTMDNFSEDFFAEGKRVRITHLRAERSPILRKIFFERNPTWVCDMCHCDTKKRYPWTNNLLELHHLLPLMSALRITLTGTSLQDVVGLCPTCHRSVHVYYRLWLNRYNVRDFQNRQEAILVYQQAKNNIHL